MANIWFKPANYNLMLLILLFPLLKACAVSNMIVSPYDNIEITASDSVNPDNNERPSPIQVKIFELSDRATFDNLDFEKLFYQSDALLSDQLLSSGDFILQPSEKLEYKVQLQPGASYIAILAGYRDIDSAKWKHAYKVKDTGYYQHAFYLDENAIKAIVKKTNSSSVSETDPADTIKRIEDTTSSAQRSKSNLDRLRGK
ncbi:type VI secretion system lipoprotein TssJ [Aurantivibrio plasticivorans]